MAAANSLVVVVALYLMLPIEDSQSVTLFPGKRSLLSEGQITGFSPSDASCCVALNCSDGTSDCAVDGDPSTVWTVKNGTQKAHIDVQLSASSLVSDISVTLSGRSVVPSSIVVTASGSDVTWMTYFNATCQPSDDYLRMRDSQYYSCIQRSGQLNLMISVPDGLFSIHNDSDDWLWWESFNRFQLTMEATDADYTNPNTSGSIEIADVQLYGWDEPRTSCNCHPVGVLDVESPCSEGECNCKNATAPNERCIPRTSIAVPTFGPVSGGTNFFTTGNYLGNATNVTLGDNYDCTIIQNNETQLRIKTSAGAQSDLHSSIPARIYWERPQGVVSLIVANWEFTYRPDPVIDSIYPLTSIISGGIPQTVTGKNLDSVAFPFITLVIISVGPIYYANFTNSRLERNDTFCHHINSTRLECISPGTETYPRYETEQTTFTISMDIDKYNDYTRCDVTDGNCKYYRTDNPVITRWEDEMVYNWYDGRKTFQVHGSNFQSGTIEKEYTITVEGVECEISSVDDNLITFYPPDPSAFATVDSSKNTILYVGYFSFTVGKIQYYLSWIDNPANRDALIIGLVCGVGGAIINILAVILFRMYRKSKKEAAAEAEAARRSPREPRDPYEVRYTRIPSLLETLPPELREKVESILIVRSQIQFEEMDELGAGNFGKVYKGVFFKTEDEREDVAIKTIRNNSYVEQLEKESFLEEATIMVDFSHPNVLSLIGVFIENELPYVVLPLMEFGDLRDFVSKPEKNLTVGDLTSYGLQVAQGMAYLAENKFVHRDLAARNCMINKSFVVKVADFGLARDIYEKDYYRTKDFNRPLPVKWMAIECLSSFTKFTEYSDVWSFGVLMWELFTRGQKPYANIESMEIKRFLHEGRRLEQPRPTPDFIYSLLLRCWAEIPTDRPTFKTIVRELRDIMSHVPDDGSEPNYRASTMSFDEAADVDQIQTEIGRNGLRSYLELTPNNTASYMEPQRRSTALELTSPGPEPMRESIALEMTPPSDRASDLPMRQSNTLGLTPPGSSSEDRAMRQSTALEFIPSDHDSDASLRKSITLELRKSDHANYLEQQLRQTEVATDA